MDSALFFSYELSLNLKFILEETAMEEALVTSFLCVHFLSQNWLMYSHKKHVYMNQ